MSWNAGQLPDLHHITAVVTGANSGLGLVTARELAAHGAAVVLACRNVGAGQDAAAGMAGRPRVEQLDLASQASVADFAERWDGPLDLLVNNGGVMMPPHYRETTDGFELQFGTNHLGHFALTARLLPALLQSERPRVMTVSSIAHFNGDRDVLAGNPKQGYSAQKAYGQSKLANLLFARELHRRANEAGVPLTSTAAHPGVSATNLATSPDGIGSRRVVQVLAPVLMRVLVPSPEAGARSSLYAACVAESGSYTGPQKLGESRGPVGPAKLSSYAADAALGQELWDRSQQWTEVSFDLK